MSRIRRGPRIALIGLAAAIVLGHVISLIGASYFNDWYQVYVTTGAELTDSQLALLTVGKFYRKYVWLLWAALILVAAWAFLSRQPRVEAGPAGA